MSTNASINVFCADGKYRSIYLHWDGYPSHVLKTLRSKYNSQELAEEILALGDCSSLADTLDESEFYFRDRNEDWSDVAPNTEKTLKACLRNNEQQYNYLFDGYTWESI